jgi:glutamyl-tRNA(Gln) amidotransferase subunit D
MDSGYSGKVLDLIKAKNIQVGDRVQVQKEGEKFVGVLMPRSELEDDRHLVIKTDDGYNLGLSIDGLLITKMPQEQAPAKTQATSRKTRTDLPMVSIISTGGTIASRVDYKTGAVSPALSAEDLYQSVPELGEIASIKTEILLSLLSENIEPANWTSMAKAVAAHVKGGSQGIVITHGTDTMGYTAAALSFALRNLPVPVVLVGSQRSSDRPSSDATLNLKGAVEVAARAPFAEVCVLMHGGSSDDALSIHRGTRVRKLHTSRRDAFRSVNVRPLGELRDGKTTLFGEAKGRGGSLELKATFDEDVVLIKSFPGVPGDLFDPIIHRGFHGIVLEGTGLGHVPASVFNQVKRATEAGMVVVMASQCIYGRVNMNVYSTGRELLKLGVIPAEDMLPETALVKLMWVLGQTTDPKKVREMFLQNLAGEISSRSEYMEEEEV